MTREMKTANVTSISAGLSQSGVRNHNERLLLSLVQRQGEMSGSELARQSGLSAPTVSAILRRLEADDLLIRGTPTRGRVGKPSVPMRLNPDGVFALGLKIGRRSADLLLLDFTGVIRAQLRQTYSRPIPKEIFAFLAKGIDKITSSLSAQDRARICGVGIGAPFELWNWVDRQPNAGEAFEHWHAIDFAAEIRAIVDLPVIVMNDATAACQAEHVYGSGKAFRDYAYFYVGAFVGGGVVLNHSVFEGRQGNAGALGSLRSIGPLGETKQLIDMASIHLLESRLREVDLDPAQLWTTPQDWSRLSRYVDPWLGQTAQELARAALSTCAVIDFEAVLIDGAFPPEVRASLVDRVRRYLATQDTRGLITPRIEEGRIGGNARAIGAACAPIFSQYLLNTNAGLALA